ncbi:DUF4365 domain-containing protein [Pedobacter polaris]|uniref:DUF4365 domain-containing protein n=1 Tax=Pedobacter polaris TaxID=2571273 RepID=A0A4U1CK70_9SPHI|nr:DUF4365 domain-containing protein [Pedobacter polaris]TKC08044.1 DUF4365 domain-containing protein [Pedobacter polaris]
MGFDDLPQVDGASMNNDTAKSRLVWNFSRNAGFIVREQFQDLGCDFKIELIEKGATNWSFDIQLKSIANPKSIKEGSMLSLAIRTSTLRYLINTAPIYGLLVIYDVSSDTLYFEYIDLLYRKLLSEKEGVDWQRNHEVRVHVPIVNILNSSSLADIHKRFVQRFKMLGAMNNEHGASYGLPSDGTITVEKGYFISIDDAVLELKEKGKIPIKQSDLSRVYELLENLPKRKILSDRDILRIAALVYSEVGKLADSIYYIDRLSKRYQLDEEDKRKIAFISLKNELGLGDIDRKTFVIKAKLLLPNCGFLEELSLRMNILYFELGSIKAFEPMPAGLVSEFEALQEMISKVQDDGQRNYLKAKNLDNLSVIVSHSRTEDMNRKAIFDQLGMKMQSCQSEKYTEKGSRLFYRLHLEYAQVGKFAFEKSEFVLLAAVTISSLKFWVDFEMDIIIFGDKGISMEKTRLELTERIDIALETATMMEHYKLFRQAYMLQCLALELLVVSRDWFGFSDLFDLGKLENQIQRMENELELSPFVSQINFLIAQKRSGNHHGLAGVAGIASMNDPQIRTYSTNVLETSRYPNARLENIIHEMSAFRTFYQRNADERFELLVMKPANPDMAYAMPHMFVIKNKKTGIQSLPAIDIDSILNSYATQQD